MGKNRIIKQWALNSAVECYPHTVDVTGSNPVAPTILFGFFEKSQPVDWVVIFKVQAILKKFDKEKNT